MPLQKYKLILICASALCLLYNCSNNNLCDNEKNVDLENFEKVTVLTKDDSLKAEWIERLIETAWKNNKFNGVFLYAENGKVLISKAFGYADFKSKTPLKTVTSFQLASITKVFTAYSIMMLAEKGFLKYDDDIKRFLPESPYEGITIRNLLNHRSGLQNYIYIAENHYNKEHILHNKDIIPLFEKNNILLEFKPGSRYRYSNTNYALLSLILERITGLNFADFLKTFVFKPLKMNNSFVLSMNDLDSDTLKAKGYILFKNNYQEMKPDYLDGVTGDKGIYSGIEDLYKFDRALRSFSTLKKETIEEAYTPPQIDSIFQHRNYGFGWRIKYSNNKRIAYHNGWWKGFKVFFIRDLSNDKTIISLNNRTNTYLKDVFAAVLNYPDTLQHQTAEAEVNFTKTINENDTENIDF